MQPNARGFRARHPDARDGRTRTALDVELDHLLGVHPVHVIGAEHDDVVGIFVVDQVQRLVDGVGGAGVPARAEPLLGRDRGDVLAGKPDSRQFCEMWRSSECDLYCVRTQIRRYRALTRLDSTKSISR